MSTLLATSKEKLKIYETVLSSPGMAAKCKIILMVSRQNIILLSRLIESSLLKDKNGFDDEILAAIPKESLEEIRTIHEEILKKSELTEFYEKLKTI